MKKYTQITIFSVLFLIVLFFIKNRNGSGVYKPNLTIAKTPTTSIPKQAIKKSSLYKDGTYTGNVENVYYGNVQIEIAISQGKISNINVLQYPNDNPTSSYISTQAISLLKQEVIQSQSSNVNIISGASYVSQGFIQSIGSALKKAS